MQLDNFMGKEVHQRAIKCSSLAFFWKLEVEMGNSYYTLCPLLLSSEVLLPDNSRCELVVLMDNRADPNELL